MKRLTISILMLVVASVYAQTNTQLYLLTGLDSSSHGGIASVTGSVFRIDQQRQLASRVIDLADGKEGIDFIRVDHDRRVVAIGTLPDRVVTLNMDSPTKTMSVSLGGHDGNGPFTVATFFFDKSPFVLAMERKKLNEPSRLLGIDMPAGPEHPLDWTDYQHLRTEGYWQPADQPLSSIGMSTDQGRLVYSPGGHRIDMGDLPPGVKKGDVLSLSISNDAISVLDVFKDRAGSNTDPAGHITLWIYNKAAKTWRTETFNGGSSSMRAFGSWIAINTGELKPNRHPKDGGVHVDPNERESPGSVLRHPKVDVLFRDANQYFPGEMVLYDSKSGKKYPIKTDQGDSEVLLVDGTTVYYRVNDTLYRADISSLGSPVPILNDDSIVPFAHWAFMGPTLSQ